MKNFFFSVLASIIFIFCLEIVSRSFIFLLTKDFKIYQYGFNKSIDLQVRKFSTFNFEVIDNKLLSAENKKKIIKKNKQKLIWAFGGSTSDVACRKINQSSWPIELNDEVYKVENFAKSGTNSDFALNTLISKLNKNISPDIILWANYVNETDVVTFGFKRNKHLSKKIKQDMSIDKTLYYIKSFSESLKDYSLFFFLLEDFYLRAMSRLNLSKMFYDINKKLTINDIEVSAENYYINTSHAINLANKHKIKFYIITLFSKSNILNQNKFTNKEKIYFEKIQELVNKNENIKWINLKQNNFLTNQKIDKMFCDNIHFTDIGNKEVSRIIKNNL